MLTFISDKNVQDLHTRKYKTLQGQKIQINGEMYSCIRKLSIINMSIFLQLMYSKWWQILSVKGQIVHTFGFIGHMILIAATQLCLCNIKVHNM